jgi:hypothetical protein
VRIAKIDRIDRSNSAMGFIDQSRSTLPGERSLAAIARNPAIAPVPQQP